MKSTQQKNSLQRQNKEQNNEQNNNSSHLVIQPQKNRSMFVIYLIQWSLIGWITLQVIQSQQGAIRWYLATSANGFLPSVQLSWEKYNNVSPCNHHSIYHEAYEEKPPITPLPPTKP